MKAVWQFLALHQTISILVGYYVISAAIGSLPAPQANSGMFYVWFFKFSNTLGGNLIRAFGSRIESSPNFLPAAQKAQDLGQLPPKQP